MYKVKSIGRSPEANKQNRIIPALWLSAMLGLFAMVGWVDKPSIGGKLLGLSTQPMSLYLRAMSVWLCFFIHGGMV
ncbi:MAG: hypothetical protein ACXWT3_11140 [Methylococcaceae bacterium]